MGGVEQTVGANTRWMCAPVAAGFRQATGTEYLAGLLHDSGKLMIEHHFPTEFEAILQRAWSARCGHFAAEREVLGLDHAQIGAAICHCLGVHPEGRFAVVAPPRSDLAAISA